MGGGFPVENEGNHRVLQGAAQRRAQFYFCGSPGPFFMQQNEPFHLKTCTLEGNPEAPLEERGRGLGGWGVGWGPAKEPASHCARVCQNYPLAN